MPADEPTVLFASSTSRTAIENSISKLSKKNDKVDLSDAILLHDPYFTKK